MKQLIMHHHLGLGDHIICNGMVHYLIEKWDISRLLLVTKKHNAPSVKALYSGESRIEILDFDPQEIDEMVFSSSKSSQLGMPLLKIAAAHTSFFDEHFYNSMNIPLAVRWDYFKPPQNLSSAQKIYDQVITTDQYCLIADKTSVGDFPLEIQSDLPTVRVSSISESLFDWIKVISMASEIHCVDSSFIHLADSLNLTGKDLNYHDVRKNSLFHLKNDWKRL